MRIKVCGMTSVEQIRELDFMGVEFAGLHFYPKSPKYIKKFHLSAIDLRHAKLNIHKVGVFVNAGKEEILRSIDLWRLDMVQLQGDESPYICQQLSEYVTVIKTLRVAESALLQWNLDQYKDACDLFLFDTLEDPAKDRGHFNWDKLEQIKIPNPFFLSGGFSNEDIDMLKQIPQRSWADKFFALDIDNGFELSNGIKDMHLLADFIKQLK
jgi:phosphoribosylanthranilate isomerase